LGSFTIIAAYSSYDSYLTSYFFSIFTFGTYFSNCFSSFLVFFLDPNTENLLLFLSAFEAGTVGVDLEVLSLELRCESLESLRPLTAAFGYGF